MSRSHYTFSPLNPTPGYPVNSALLKFPEYRGNPICLCPEHWSALGKFFERMGWDIEWTTCAMPRLWIEQTRARGRLDKRLSRDDTRTVVQYELKSPYDARPEDCMSLSRGLCVSIANSIENGSMERETPELHTVLAPSLVKWRECGGLSGMYVVE
ncbi:hypothetical protein G3N58_31525 [Paraburkholderia sp. Ac-20342]|uniref:hypothetical protein n=1 Tax=Paraburkholderia sp. Ac-20342 TaxID=2703889 RepID=UPI001980264B|nr:hypothetical protein [Paraburkholderia sp. Ac-20342]MBN3851318.1 hypothetical protein [Paraburkholderia sp. Ac-20342]